MWNTLCGNILCCTHLFIIYTVQLRYQIFYAYIKSVANVYLFIILVASYSLPKCSSCMELISIEVGCYTKLIQLHYIYKGKLKFLFNIIYTC